MSDYNIEAIYNSLELPAGARFYFRNVLYEVAELEGESRGCSKCEFDNKNEREICEVMNCNSCRHDKNIYFKEVTEAEERHNNE